MADLQSASTITETDAASAAVLDSSSTYVIKDTIGTDIDLDDTAGANADDGAKVIGLRLQDQATPDNVKIVGTNFSEGATSISENGKRLVKADDNLELGDILVTGTGTGPDVTTAGTSRTANRKS